MLEPSHPIFERNIFQEAMICTTKNGSRTIQVELQLLLLVRWLIRYMFCMPTVHKNEKRGKYVLNIYVMKVMKIPTCFPGNKFRTSTGKENTNKRQPVRN